MRNTEKYYDRVAKDYNKKILRNPYENYRFEQITDKILEFIPRKLNMKILDVGCGTGEFTFSVLPSILKNASFFGVDFSKEMIRICKNRFPEFEFEVMDAQDLKFKDGSFDLVISRQMLEHLPKPLLALKEMHRVLKQDGILILSTPSWFGLIGPLYFVKKATKTMQPIDDWKTPSSLKAMFKKTGFLNIKFDSVCYIPYHSALPVKGVRLIRDVDKLLSKTSMSKYFGRTLIFRAQK